MNKKEIQKGFLYGFMFLVVIYVIIATTTTNTTSFFSVESFSFDRMTKFLKYIFRSFWGTVNYERSSSNILYILKLLFWIIIACYKTILMIFGVVLYAIERCVIDTPRYWNNYQHGFTNNNNDDDPTNGIWWIYNTIRRFLAFKNEDLPKIEIENENLDNKNKIIKFLIGLWVYIGIPFQIFVYSIIIFIKKKVDLIYDCFKYDVSQENKCKEFITRKNDGFLNDWLLRKPIMFITIILLTIVDLIDKMGSINIIFLFTMIVSFIIYILLFYVTWKIPKYFISFFLLIIPIITYCKLILETYSSNIFIFVLIMPLFILLISSIIIMSVVFEFFSRDKNLKIKRTREIKKLQQKFNNCFSLFLKFFILSFLIITIISYKIIKKTDNASSSIPLLLQFFVLLLQKKMFLIDTEKINDTFKQYFTSPDELTNISKSYSMLFGGMSYAALLSCIVSMFYYSFQIRELVKFQNTNK